MTERERVRWQLGLVVFHALKRALSIPGVDQSEVAKAFTMAAMTLREPPEIDAPPLVPSSDSIWRRLS
jgi:hypothetical protein